MKKPYPNKEAFMSRTSGSSERGSRPSVASRKQTEAEEVAAESMRGGDEVVSRRFAAKLLAGAGLLAVASCAKDGAPDDEGLGGTAEALSGGSFLWADTLSDLRSVIGSDTSGTSQPVIVMGGYTTVGDGGGGVFYWDTSSSTGDNGGTIIVPTGSTTGRWLRLFTGAVSVRWFGAKGDASANDTAAIQAAINACSANGGTVLLPNGTYIVSSSATIDAGCLQMKTGVRLVGESKTGTVIKLASGQPGFTRPIVAYHVNDIAICNLTIDGSKASQSVEEHRAGIFLDTVSRVVIQDCILHHHSGDGVDIYIVNDIVMERCWCHDNDRKAVSINGGPNNRMVIRDCMFENNVGQLHIESEGTCTDLWFEDTYCGEPAGGGLPVSIGGIARGAYLRGLEIHGGLNISTDARRIRVSDCYIEAGLVQGSSGPCPLVIAYDIDDCIVEGCTIYQSAAQGSSDHCVYIVSATSMSSQRPRRIVLRDNHISSEYVLANAVAIVNAQEVSLVGNHLVNPQNANDARAAIAVSATDSSYASPQVGTVIVRGNYIYNWFEAIAVGAAANLHVGSVTVANNVVERGGVATCKGWDLDSGTHALQQCAVLNNELINVTPTWVTYPTCPILIGGERGGSGMYLCAGTPEGVIAETVGAIARRRDGGAGTTLYVKESGTGNTGWVAK